jgi:hypothetical protein
LEQAGVIRTRLPLIVAVVALAGAVFLTLIARDVRRWESSLETGDRRFAIGPGPDDLWEPQARLVPGVARSLLAIDDDLEFRQAAQLFRRSRPRAAAQRTQADLATAARAQSALTGIERNGADSVRRAAAASALGVLSLSDALSDSTQAALFFRKSISKFNTAIRLDPGNREAAANLELVLRLAQAAVSRVDDDEEVRGGGTSAGAGSGSSGSGF